MACAFWSRARRANAAALRVWARDNLWNNATMDKIVPNRRFASTAIGGGAVAPYREQVLKNGTALRTAYC